MRLFHGTEVGSTTAPNGRNAPDRSRVVPHVGPDTAETTETAERDEAFREYVVPELEVLLRVARRLTGDAHLAEDMVQETLLRTYRAIDRFDGRYPRAWLLTILRNATKNHWRKQKKVSDFSEEILESTAAPGADGRTGPQEIVLDEMLDPPVADALRSLSEDFRAVVILVDVDGLSYQEAADTLDIPIGTVMSRLHRARNRMRDQLREAGYLPGGAS